MMDSQHHCDACGKKFHRQDNYINHKKVHENGFDCDVCQKPHSSLEDLVVHIERVHNPKIGYDCVVCQKPHRCLEDLLVHLENQHSTTTGK